MYGLSMRVPQNWALSYKMLQFSKCRHACKGFEIAKYTAHHSKNHLFKYGKHTALGRYGEYQGGLKKKKR